jgi:hypothetical protein
MSRSGTEIDAYNNLSAKLKEVNKKLRAIDHMAMKATDKQHLTSLEAAMQRIIMQCNSKQENLEVLRRNAKEAMKTFNDKYNPEHSAAAAVVPVNPLDGFDMEAFFSDEISPPVKKSPPPLPSSMVVSNIDIDQDKVKLERPIANKRRDSLTASHTMFVQDDSTFGGKQKKEKTVERPMPKEIVMLLDDHGGDIELSAAVANKLDKESPEVICMIVSHMIDNYQSIIKKFIPAADNEDRKTAAIQLLGDLNAVQTILKSQDPMHTKVGAVKMMKAHFSTAEHNSLLDGKDLLNRTLTSKIFHAKKVSAVSIFSRWDKEKVPFDSMVVTLEAKVRLASQKPPSPRAGSHHE